MGSVGVGSVGVATELGVSPPSCACKHAEGRVLLMGVGILICLAWAVNSLDWQATCSGRLLCLLKYVQPVVDHGAAIIQVQQLVSSRRGESDRSGGGGSNWSPIT